MRIFLFFLFAFYAFGLPATAEADPAPLTVENSFLSVEIDGKPYRLQAMIVKEATRTGRLPVALITHGQSNDLASRQSVDPANYIFVAREFARRGWLSVVVARLRQIDGLGALQPAGLSQRRLRRDLQTAGRRHGGGA